MRTDPNKSYDFTENSEWNRQRYENKIVVKDTTGENEYQLNSFSGHEANHFFLQHDGSFLDLTLVSGVDHLGDGRGFAILDFNNDGWQDIALISTNQPRLQLFENRMGNWLPQNNRLRIQLVGSHDSSTSNLNATNRDGIGAKIWIQRASGTQELMQHQVGEGNVAQNSSWIWVSQPADNPAQSIEVVWPTGRKSTRKIAANENEIIIKEPAEAL